jgi:hypothetical protein
MKRFFFWIVLAALLLGLQEILFRALFPMPEIENFNRITYSDVVPHLQTASFFGKRVPAMNATFRWKSRPDGVTTDSHLNLYGFRDRNWRVRREHGTERVMFVGDSLVEGFMAGDHETISHGFSRAAVEDKEAVEAMNFGIGGTGIDNYLALMRDAVPLFRPQRIVVVIYANDLPYVSPPPRNPAPPVAPVYTPAWEPRGLLVIRRALRHEVVPRRWHGRPTLFAPVVPDPLNPWSQPPAEFAQVDPVLAEAMRKGDFNPFVVNLLNQAESNLRQPIDLNAVLPQFQSIAQRVSAELRIVYLPFSAQVSDYYVAFQQKYAEQKGVRSLIGPEYQIHAEALAKSCRELRIPFFDLTPSLRKAETEGPHLYWNFDEHMRGSAYLRVGATIQQWVHTSEKIETLRSLK